MSELKPCPCCGCEKVIFEQYKKNGFRIVCKGCALKREQKVTATHLYEVLATTKASLKNSKNYPLYTKRFQQTKNVHKWI